MMTTAVARQGNTVVSIGGLAQIIVPAAMAFGVFFSVSASLHRSIPSERSGTNPAAEPAEMPTRSAAPVRSVTVATPEAAGHIDARPLDHHGPAAEGASPIPALPPGALSAARAKLKSLAQGKSLSSPPPIVAVPHAAWVAARARLQVMAMRSLPARPALIVASRETTGDGARPEIASPPLVPPTSATTERKADEPKSPSGPAVPPPSDGNGVHVRSGALASYDQVTAVYEIASHTVYLPDGTKLEAHSGLGPRRDDPRSIGERMRGATPPNVYDIQTLDKLFHGVRALRLNPVGDGNMFGRDGMLAHTYMLGPNGDSNGCVVFKDYKAFLKAWDDGAIKKLAVVARLD